MKLHHSYTALFDFDRSAATPLRQEEPQLLPYISQLPMLVGPGGGWWDLQLCLRRFDQEWDSDCAACCVGFGYLRNLPILKSHSACYSMVSRGSLISTFICHCILRLCLRLDLLLLRLSIFTILLTFDLNLVSPSRFGRNEGNFGAMEADVD